jgi:hypothetical protein
MEPQHSAIIFIKPHITENYIIIVIETKILLLLEL